MCLLFSFAIALLPSLYCSFQFHEYTDVLSITREIFIAYKCNCIIVVQTFYRSSPYFTELQQLAFDIAKGSNASWPMQVSLDTLPVYTKKLLNQEQLESGTCFKPLNIVLVGEGTKDELRTLSQEFHLKKSIWLLFMNGTNSAREFFKDINLSYNAGVFIASTKIELVTVSEIYKLDVNFPPRIGHIGVWSAEHGFIGTKEPRYKRRSDLRGLHLKTGTTEAWPMSSFVRGRAGKDQVIDGFFADVWFHLQEKMNFTTSFYRDEDNSVGTLQPDGSWSGLIGMLSRGEIDVVLTELDYSPKRLDVLEPLLPILKSNFQIFFRGNGYLIDWMALFRPFSMDVWFAILMWIAVTSVSLSIFSNLSYYCGITQRVDYTPFNAFFFALQSISFQGTQRTPQAWGCRLLFLFCYLTATILVPSYAAALISSLTKKIPSRPFNSLDDLIQANNFILLLSGGSAYEYFESGEKNSKIFRAYEKLVKPALPHFGLKMDFVEKLRYVCEHDNAAYFGTQGWAETIIRTKLVNCNLAKLKAPVAIIHQSLALAKKSPLTDAFNYNIMIMQESGILKRFLLKHRQRWIPERQEKVEPVTIHDAMEAFLLFACALLLSIVIFIAERFKRQKMTAFQRSL